MVWGTLAVFVLTVQSCVMFTGGGREVQEREISKKAHAEEVMILCTSHPFQLRQTPFTDQCSARPLRSPCVILANMHGVNNRNSFQAWSRVLAAPFVSLLRNLTTAWNTDTRMGSPGYTFLYHHDRHQITLLAQDLITYCELPSPHIEERATATATGMAS